MLRPLARGVSINIFTPFFLISVPPVDTFILLSDRPSNHAARTEIDIKARETQLT